MMNRACVIGSGPNGLAAAIVLARAGMRVEVFEAEAEPGGAVRTLPLTLPGFLHDFGSAVYPLLQGRHFSLRCRWAITDWNGYMEKSYWRIRSTMARPWFWSETWSTQSAGWARTESYGGV